MVHTTPKIIDSTTLLKYNYGIKYVKGILEEPPLKRLCHRNLRSNFKSKIPDGNLNKDMIKAIEEQVKERILS